MAPLPRRTFALVPAFLLGFLAQERASAAQNVALAKVLYDKGYADMEAGRYEKGCAELSESLEMDRRPGTLFTLATCESRWGRVATAMARYEQYLTLYEHLAPAEQARQRERVEVAKKELEKLAKSVPRLTILLPPSAPPGTVVKWNGRVIGKATLGDPWPVDPGRHKFTTQAPDGPAVEQVIDMELGSNKPLRLDVKPSDKPPPRDFSDPKRTAGWIAGGIGLVGVGVGAATLGLALQKRQIVEGHCGSALGYTNPLDCDGLGAAAGEASGDLGNASIAGFVVGAVGLGTGIALLAASSKRDPEDKGTPSPRVHISVLPGGPAGTFVFARGSW